MTALTSMNYHLQNFSPSDVHHVFRGLSDPEVIRYYGVQYDSLEATLAQMLFFDELERTGTGKWWAVGENETGLFCGAAGLNNVERESGRAEIGCWLLPEYQGKGIMKEVLPLVIQFGWQTFQLQRIEAVIETDNRASRELFKQLGFELEHTLIDAEIKEGRNISLDVFTLFRENLNV